MTATDGKLTIGTHTRLFGVIGDPIVHSLSPLMHNAAFRQTGVDAVYLAFHVKDLPGAVAGFRALNIGGISVTIPHKVSIMDLLDEVEPMAREIGAVNSIINQGGRLIGFNSDSPGATAALSEKTVIKGKRVAVIGAGGAARAMAHGIRSHGGRLTIVNRSEARGRQLAEAMDGDFCPLADFRGDGTDILVNTTSVGMSPNTDHMPVSRDGLHPGMTVMDMVYNPLETRLLRASREIGCTVVDGVAMFVHQGAIQFERWTGQKAPVALMKKMVLNALTGRA
ncbi:shikimate dehydrogenase [Desulfosarcina ovata subsp. sediminis]|uniref:Shikimate dehydrogenase (NADP(+)) n=1 Tax=Desulfosarcina ovata subsp. sediminis TaxID=885957 RepID=A0A5K7ZV12_9BACT|nr:shikimate dehydrogenase [Desulfosarcina ovata]BBO84082.1 shikimate dehydrogenase [Desulfosarcina ovata subsp. sediminis]